MIGLANMKIILKIKKLFIPIIFISLFFISARAEAVTMFVGSAEETVYAGDTFLVDYFLNTEGQTINSIDATIYYSPDTLQVVDTSLGNSAVVYWVNKPTITKDGALSFVGGIPGGINGSQIPILRVLFKAKKVGNATIMTDGPTSNVFLNDGAGTTLSFSMKPVSFAILPLSSKLYTITSPTNPNQNKWYHNHDVSIVVKAKPDELFSYSFVSNSEIIPNIKPTKISGPLVYKNVPDGVYYFKLAIPSGGGLQEVGVYRIQIDNTPPEFLSSSIEKNSSIFNGKSFVNFIAVDKMSGIDKYKVKTGWFGFYHTATSPYQIRRPIFGSNIKIKVIDVAGNYSITKVPFAGYLSPFFSWCVILVLLLAIIFRNKKKRKQLFLWAKKIF